MLPAEGKRHRFTVEECHRMVETGLLTEGDRVEFIDGELVEMAAIGWRHASVTFSRGRAPYANGAWCDHRECSFELRSVLPDHGCGQGCFAGGRQAGQADQDHAGGALGEVPELGSLGTFKGGMEQVSWRELYE